MSHKSGPAPNIKDLLAQATQSHRNGQLAVAEVLYRDVLKVEPKNFDALHMLAVVGYQTGQIADSLLLFQEAHELRPQDARLLVNYGAALRQAERFDEALTVYDRAIALQPNSHEALFNKAQCLALDKKQFEEAIALYRECLRHAPKDTDTLTSLGNVLKRVGQWREAIDYYEQAIAINPNASLPYVAMAQLFRDKDWITSAILVYDKALSLAPRDPIARTHRSIALLRNGQLREGWKDYDGRFWYLDERVPRRPLPPVYWDGEDLTGKTILIWSEQGVGDEILYSSILPDVIARAKNVVFECDPRMAPIYARSFPTLEVHGWVERERSVIKPEKMNYQSSIGSIGRFCRNEFAEFPKHSGYLKADPEKVAQLRARYGAGPLVGVSWRSGAARIGEAKSLNLKDWDPVLRAQGAKFISLQYGDTAEDIAAAKAALGIDVLQDPDVNSLRDMDTFAAQVAAMDLVISTSNTAVHMAGALGKPTWVMLPAGQSALWYWFMRREDSPWYPALKLYRQSTPGQWDGVISRVGADFPTWLRRAQT